MKPTPRPEHICHTCVHFGVRTCCEKAVCAEQNWDDSTDDHSYGGIENFLWEMVPDNQCDDWNDKIKTKQEWIRGAPSTDGWYWVYNVESGELGTVIVKRDRVFPPHLSDNPALGYPLSWYINTEYELWHMPCDTPELPQ